MAERVERTSPPWLHNRCSRASRLLGVSFDAGLASLGERYSPVGTVTALARDLRFAI